MGVINLATSVPELLACALDRGATTDTVERRRRRRPDGVGCARRLSGAADAAGDGDDHDGDGRGPPPPAELPPPVCVTDPRDVSGPTVTVAMTADDAERRRRQYSADVGRVHRLPGATDAAGNGYDDGDDGHGPPPAAEPPLPVCVAGPCDESGPTVTVAEAGLKSP